MKNFLPGALFLCLSACAAAPDKPNGCIAYSPAIPLIAQLGRVCATQFNGQWAVSVKHGRREIQASSAYDAMESPDYDLIFFRREAEAPTWRDAIAGETVTAEGNTRSVLDFLVALPVPSRETATGIVISTNTRLCGGKVHFGPCGAVVIVSTVKLEKGYSGGPLFGTDGAVVGINIGFATTGQAISWPTSFIRAEFDRLIAVKSSRGATYETYREK